MKKLIFTILFCFMASVCWADEYYLGQWEWNDTDHTSEYWEAPHKPFLVGSIDLRALPQQALAGGTPQGYGLFVYSQTINDNSLIYLGSGEEANIPKNVQNKLKNHLGYEGDLTTSTIKDVVYELLALKGDSTGQSRWKPLMPDRNRKNKVIIGGRIIKQAKIEPFVSPEWDLILATEQENYKNWIRTEEPERIAKALDFLEDKYGVQYNFFIPVGYTKLASLPHETTITESFNTSRSTTLGPDLTWTETNGDWWVSNNNDNEVSSLSSYTNADARAESDLSGSDMYSLITVTALSNSDNGDKFGPAARFKSDARTYYTTYPDLNVNKMGLQKCVAGTYTELDTAVSITISLPEEYKIEVDGSSIEGFQAGTSRISATDTAITGNTRAGLRAYKDNTGSPQGDNFEAADLAAPPVARRRIILF